MDWVKMAQEQAAGREDLVMRIDLPKVEGINDAWLVARVLKGGLERFP